MTEEQRALRAGMRELVARRFPRDRLRAAVDEGADPGVWPELAAAGLFRLRLDGMGAPEAAVVFEEAGRALLPGPLVSTHLAATYGLVAAAERGEAVVAGCDGALVDHLAGADAVLVADGRRALVCAPDALPAERMASVDPLTELWRLPSGWSWPESRPESESESGSGRGAADPAALWRDAVVLTAAEQSGSAARTVELAVEHARSRRQFGRPIGAFQAVKHLCARMLVRAELARTAVYAAAVTGDPAETAAAKLLADEAAVDNARDCLQVFGGTGFTWESDVHLHLKRAWLRAGRYLDRAAAEEALADALPTPATDPGRSPRRPPDIHDPRGRREA
nr:acyl-CoA dehydrogenase family protein [Streptomyces sp. SID5468]